LIEINCTIDGNDIILPEYSTLGASGMDVRAWKYAMPDDLSQTLEFPEQGIKLRSLERILIKTGIHVEIPDGYEIQIRPRSGLALKHGITVLNTPATIDADYRGEIGVILINLSPYYFTIKKGDRIAQFVLQKVEKANFNVVKELSDTVRGQDGFNSTGIK
jgi:dUTP pyrophosphatase